MVVSLQGHPSLEKITSKSVHNFLGIFRTQPDTGTQIATKIKYLLVGGNNNNKNKNNSKLCSQLLNLNICVIYLRNFSISLFWFIDEGVL